MKVHELIGIIGVILLWACSAFASHLGYYRYPTQGGGKVVFTAEGDLWRVSIDGGMAQRLTTHAGYETHAAISPDGKTVAFTAQYEGPSEVYTIPLTGGVPTRHTFEGARAEVVGWTNDGDILYRTRHFSTLPNWQIVRLDPTSNRSTILPLAQASTATIRSDGTIFFTRLPFQGSATKRYQGGTAETLWKKSPQENEAVGLSTSFVGTSKAPMIVGERLFFVSDRDGTMNLWSSDFDGARLRQHSFHKGWDLQEPSYSTGSIVYQVGADLYRYDTKAQREEPISIELTSDLEQLRERWVKKPIEYITSSAISPDGKRMVLTARGQIFVVPLKSGRLVQVTKKQGVRYRHARFLPDGKSIVALSDETGELEFWKLSANGVGRVQQLSSGGDILRFAGVPSPDGKWLAYSDKNFDLWILDLRKGNSRKVANSMEGAPRDLTWTPDSQWLGYVMDASNYISQIHLYSVKSGKSRVLTSDRMDSYSPQFSLDGKWLYFLSDRTLRSVVRSPWGPRQPEPFLDKTTKIYQVSLRDDKSLRSPFLPDDELVIARRALSKEGGKKKSQPKKPVRVRVDFKGIVSRVVEVPVEAGNYSSLRLSGSRLFWLEEERGLESRVNLQTIEITSESPKVELVASDIAGYQLTPDGKNLLIRKKKSFYSVPAKPNAEKKLEKNRFDLSSWVFSIEPREEWRQLFVEAWRLERDYFYDRSMHGTDWKRILQKYLPLVDRVTDRAELSNLISQMVGELSALHTFVRRGDHRKGLDSVMTGHLGAVIKLRKSLGGARVDYIYRSDPDLPNERSPLDQPHLGINEGDILEAINGTSVLKVPNWRALLRNQVGKPVRIRVWSRSNKRTEEKMVTPISAKQERELRYDDWEYSRRLRVETQGLGKLGYVHLRAMGAKDYSAWAQNFYPVFNRQGLIIDVRNNRGGNIDSWILEKLMRKAWFYWQGRAGNPTWNMQYAFRGHMVVLCNEFTASDGEAFAEGFRRLGLGKIIGTRTWGGEIWLSYNNWLVDNGIASAAEYGVYGPEGEWLIEGHGVEPDIVVDNLPHATFLGQDSQLQAAISHLKELIAADPRPVPLAPKHPDKSFPAHQ